MKEFLFGIFSFILSVIGISTDPATTTPKITPKTDLTTVRSPTSPIFSEETRSLQEILIREGYLTLPKGTTLGYFDNQTRLALKRYQGANGIPATGEYGPLTKARLASSPAKAPAQTPPRQAPPDSPDTAPKPPLPKPPAQAKPSVTLTVSPNSIRIGQRTTLRWKSGNALLCQASGDWTGSQDLSGVTVKNPASNSSYTLTCRNDAGETSATASVTVTDAPPPPPPPAPAPAPPTPPDPPPSGGGPSSYPNEPGGMVKISERGFDSLLEDGWGMNPVYASSTYRITSDSSAPKSAPSVAEVGYLETFFGGEGPINTWQSSRFSGKNYTTIYISFWYKLSSDWQGHPGSGVSKVMHIWNGNQGTSENKNRVFLANAGRGAGPYVPQIMLQQIYSDGGYRNLYANVSPNFSINRGEWHRWEVLMVSNTGDSADGKATLWIDGQKISEYSDIGYTSAAQGKSWNSVSWAPTWGGAGGSVQAPGMTAYMDHIYISAK